MTSIVRHNCQKNEQLTEKTLGRIAGRKVVWKIKSAKYCNNTTGGDEYKSPAEVNRKERFDNESIFFYGILCDGGMLLNGERAAGMGK